MPSDERVLQPWGEKSCLIAASACLLEVMSGRNVTEDISALYQRAVAVGLYDPTTSDLDEAVIAVMQYVGAQGVACDSGRIYGAYPYAISVDAMMDALALGMKPFILAHPKPDGVLHAVCVKGVTASDLIVAEQEFDIPGGFYTRTIAIDWARANGLGAYAFVRHMEFIDSVPVIPEESVQEYLAPGMVADLFGEWRAASKVARTDYTSARMFADHLAALGQDNSNLQMWGFPVWASAPEPLQPEAAPPRAPEVLDASNVDIGPSIAGIAERYDLPGWALHACLIAESGMNPRAERWGNRSTEGRALTGRIDAGPGDEQAYRLLQELIFTLQASGYGADISFGYSQLIVRTASGYGIGDGSNEIANVLDVRRQLFDRAVSIDLGARHLAMCGKRVNDELGIGLDGDPVEFIVNALAAYNSGSPKPPGASYWTVYAANVASYRRAIEQAFPIWV